MEGVSYNAFGIAEGGTLYAVDPSNPSSKTTLGTLPTNVGVYGFGIGDDILLAGTDSSSGEYQTDIFYANLSEENSLQRVTNTLNTDEMVIF